MADEILYENRGRVAVVTINRPEARNAINTGVREGLLSAQMPKKAPGRLLKNANRSGRDAERQTRGDRR